MKFGQMLSTRRDLFPAQWVDELAKLQDKVEAFPGEQARQLIIEQLDLVQITDLFEQFDETPLASASIAQVHTAQLKQADGSLADVVIKVIRPDIKPQILADLELMEAFGSASSPLSARWQKTAAARSGSRVSQNHSG